MAGNFSRQPDQAAVEHLADAKLHLQRALLAIKAASIEAPQLVVQLGTPHATLAEVLRDLERNRG